MDAKNDDEIPETPASSTGSSPKNQDDETPIEPPKTPERSDPAFSSTKDQGSFLPSACISPIAATNKNFTFGSNQSSIPRIQKSLNC